MTTLRLLLILFTVLASPRLLAETPESSFAHAARLMEAHRYRDALPVLKALAVTLPDNPNVLWNLGITAAKLDDAPLALRTWQDYRRAAPADWRGLTKLIQSHQALGQAAERDAARAELFRFRAGLPDVSRTTLAFYCRDIFRVGSREVMALEYFDPSDAHPVFYRFSVLDADGREVSYLTLSRDPEATFTANALDGAAPARTIFRLEQRGGSTRSTLQILSGLPPYDALRALAIRAIAGEPLPRTGYQDGFTPAPSDP